MQQPKWSVYEVALLIDTYIRIEKDLDQREIDSLSALLRAYGLRHGEIDDTYRNYNGISLRLGELQYLFSNGEKGVSHTSELFRKMVRIYNDEPKKFEEVLAEARALYGLKPTKKLQFFDWLDGKESIGFINKAKELVPVIDDYCKKKKLSEKGLIYIDSKLTLQKIEKSLRRNIMFRVLNAGSYDAIIATIEYYSEFLQESDAADKLNNTEINLGQVTCAGPCTEEKLCIADTTGKTHDTENAGRLTEEASSTSTEASDTSNISIGGVNASFQERKLTAVLQSQSIGSYTKPDESGRQAWENPSDSNNDELISFFSARGIEWVDNRKKRGALWIIGNDTMKEVLLPLEERGYFFRYVPKGGKASGGRNAWFLLPNKQCRCEAENEELQEQTKEWYVIDTKNDTFIGKTPAEAFARFCEALAEEHHEKFSELVGQKYGGKGSVVLLPSGDNDAIKLTVVQAYVRKDLSEEAAIVYGKWLCSECNDARYSLSMRAIEDGAMLTDSSGDFSAGRRKSQEKMIDEKAENDTDGSKLFSPVSETIETDKRTAEKTVSLSRTKLLPDEDQGNIIKESRKDEVEGKADEGLLVLPLQKDANCEKEEAQNSDGETKRVILGKLYNINPYDYEDIKIEAVLYSTRVRNVMRRNGIITVSDLLHHSWNEILSMKNLGKTSAQEIEKYLREVAGRNAIDGLESKQSNLNEANTAPLESTAIIRYRDLIGKGCFEVIREKEELDADELAILQRYEDAYNLLGAELVDACSHNQQAITTAVTALQNTIQRLEIQKRKDGEIKQLLAMIPPERFETKVEPYVAAFTRNKEVKERICFPDYEQLSLGAFVKQAYQTKSEYYSDISKFLRWCSFDVTKEIDMIFDKLFSNERVAVIIRLRSKKTTLEVIGNKLGITRERVRQLEKKAAKSFAAWYSRAKSLQKISAIKNGKAMIDKTDICEFCGPLTDEFVFLLNHIESQSFFYDDQVEAFIVGKSFSTEITLDEIEQLPRQFGSKDLREMISKVCSSSNAPEEYVTKVIAKNYTLTGDVYHRARLSLKDVYSDVLGKYYQRGIHIYDDDEIQRFRKHVIDDYGQINLPETNHAVAAYIMRYGIQRNRGTYGPRVSNVLSERLVGKIDAYIKGSKSSVILINAVFKEFRQELLACGVDNQYFLLGVLHDTFDGIYIIRKNCIYRDSDSTSIYKEIVKYIMRADTLVSKDEIIKAFPGVTDIVIQAAIMDERILNYFGEYLYARCLEIYEDENKQMHSRLKKIISDGKEHHIKEVFDCFQVEFKEALDRNAIIYAFRLFSVLEYLYGEEFQFSRPYIAEEGVNIGRAGERLKELILESDEIEIAEITSFAKNNQFQIFNLLEYLNSFSDTHFFKSKKALISVEKIGIGTAFKDEIERAIFDEIGDDTVFIANLECIHTFRSISIPWNEWTLYSMIRKWSSCLEVALTDAQLKRATPIVARKGNLRKDAFDDMDDISKISFAQADDLDSIDDLISDYILDGDT